MPTRGNGPFERVAGIAIALVIALKLCDQQTAIPDRPQSATKIAPERRFRKECRDVQFREGLRLRKLDGAEPVLIPVPGEVRRSVPRPVTHTVDKCIEGRTFVCIRHPWTPKRPCDEVPPWSLRAPLGTAQAWTREIPFRNNFSTAVFKRHRGRFERIAPAQFRRNSIRCFGKTQEHRPVNGIDRCGTGYGLVPIAPVDASGHRPIDDQRDRIAILRRA
ncbi:hypothetical protein DSM104443_02785 [Usitatibacter rugosus]|uniref:Uncharacterized protein n=1 Tax=Usitatibacter rugosus TaxID=2732067 RepID=A0A6M4GZ45_9PROT|nr:hypothetical protein DSM104443_02785 [Usitatibacter rugosus]